MLSRDFAGEAIPPWRGMVDGKAVAPTTYVAEHYYHHTNCTEPADLEIEEAGLEMEESFRERWARVYPEFELVYCQRRRLRYYSDGTFYSQRAWIGGWCNNCLKVLPPTEVLAFLALKQREESRCQCKLCSLVKASRVGGPCEVTPHFCRSHEVRPLLYDGPAWLVGFRFKVGNPGRDTVGISTWKEANRIFVGDDPRFFISADQCARSRDPSPVRGGINVAYPGELSLREFVVSYYRGAA